MELKWERYDECKDSRDERYTAVQHIQNNLNQCRRIKVDVAELVWVRGHNDYVGLTNECLVLVGFLGNFKWPGEYRIKHDVGTTAAAAGVKRHIKAQYTPIIE